MRTTEWTKRTKWTKWTERSTTSGRSGRVLIWRTKLSRRRKVVDKKTSLRQEALIAGILGTIRCAWISEAVRVSARWYPREKWHKRKHGLEAGVDVILILRSIAQFIIPQTLSHILFLINTHHRQMYRLALSTDDTLAYHCWQTMWDVPTSTGHRWNISLSLLINNVRCTD